MIKNIRNFITESVDEMRHKVSWPTYSSLQSNTVIVLVASLIFSLLIGGIDIVFENLMKTFYNSF